MDPWLAVHSSRQHHERIQCHVHPGQFGGSIPRTPPLMDRQLHTCESCFTRPSGEGEARSRCYFLDFFLAFLFFFFAMTSSLRPIDPKLVPIGIT